jgi:hypothetical protein
MEMSWHLRPRFNAPARNRKIPALGDGTDPHLSPLVAQKLTEKSLLSRLRQGGFRYFLIAIFVGTVMPPANAEIEKDGRLFVGFGRNLIRVSIDAVQFETKLRFSFRGFLETISVRYPSPYKQTQMPRLHGIKDVGFNLQMLGEDSPSTRAYQSAALGGLANIDEKKIGGQISLEIQPSPPTSVHENMAGWSGTVIFPSRGENPPRIAPPGNARASESFPLNPGLTGRVNVGPKRPDFGFFHCPDCLIQPASLQAKNEELQNQNNGSDAGYRNRPPFYRRLVLAISGVLLGFFGSVWGWNNFDNKRRFFGAGLIGGSLLLACLGLGLFWLTNFAWSWGWVL